MAETAAYPRLNPFPYQGTQRIEGDPPGEDSESRGSRSPTLLMDAVAQLREVAQGYLTNYCRATQESGRAALLWGEHGSGKTHSIRFTMTEVVREQRGVEGGSPTIQVYTKADGPDFLALYRSLLAQIEMATLRDAALRFQGDVAVRELSSEVGTSAAKRREIDLRAKPEVLFEMLGEYEIDQGKLEIRQARAIGDAVGGRRDFRWALSYLLSDRLATDAYDWLVGRHLSEQQMRQIGVSGPIETPDLAKWGLQLVARLLNSAKVPYIFYVDQIEKFILGPDQMTLLAENAGILHSLVEEIPKQNGLVVIAGNKQAWDALLPDLKQRFTAEIRHSELTLQQAKQIVRVYLASDAVQPAADLDEAELFPFTEGAVRAMQQGSGGNIRMLLQICAVAFDEAFPEKRMIDKGTIEKVLKAKSSLYFDHAKIAIEIEGLLAQNGLRALHPYRWANMEVDLAVLGRNDQPRCLFEIQDALFYSDEAHRALRTLALIERAHDQKRPTPVVLVVLGYASREVIELLRPRVTSVLVYRKESFASQLMEVMDRLFGNPTSQASDRERRRLKKKLASLRKSLEDLNTRRESDARSLEERLERLLLMQAKDRSREAREQAWIAWPQERQRIEEAIESARAARRTAELAELEKLRAEAQRGLRMQVVFFGVAVAATLLVASAVVFQILRMPEAVLIPAVVFLIATLGSIWFRYGADLAHLFSSRVRDLTLRVSSRAELDLRSLALSGNTSGLLKHHNPQVRYAAAATSSGEMAPRFLAKCLSRERSAMVRRRLAQRADRWENFNLPIPEMPYIIEACASAKWNGSTYKMSDSTPRRFRLIVLLATRGEAAVPGHDLPLRLGWAMYSNHGFRDRALAEAFERGLSTAFGRDLDLSEDEVRDAVRALSPLEEGGLGTYDELKDIQRIDKIYVFCRQLLFLSAWNFVSGEEREERGAVSSGDEE